MRLYSHLGAKPYETALEWSFRTKMRMKFAHLEYEKNVLDWQGSQIPYLGFDELTHFTASQFFYMLSRNRSLSGVSGYVRATCNPDATSWVRKLIDWWIDPVTGLAISERSGVIRWFVRLNDEMHWGDTKEELEERLPGESPKSFTFIAAKLSDNKILMEKDPSYLANLKAQSRVDRERLLGGNWNIKASAGNFFRREWFEIVDAAPSDVRQRVRYWDRAATKPSETNSDPDWTAGPKMSQSMNGLFFVEHVARERDTPLKIEQLVKNTATQDGRSTAVWIEQDPGSAGVADAGNMTRLLAGFVVRVNKPTNDKATRAKPLSAQAEAGNVKLVRGDWNEAFLSELENFSDNPKEYAHDDQVDGASGAFNALTGEGASILDVL